MSHMGPISKEEWFKLRQEAQQSFPEALVGKSLPEVLLAYQQELLATTAINQVTVVEKSRRTGYTWGVGADAVLTSAAAKSAGGMDTLYIGYNLDMAREFVDTCGMWAKAFNQVASEVEEFIFTDKDENGDKTIQAFRIRFASGYEIVALSSKPRSLRGRQGYVIIDEAAFHDDLPELLKAALALLIWGGKVLVISTHDGADNPFNELVEEIKKGRKPYALITLDFDEALKQGLYQRVCLVRGLEWSPKAEAEWRDSIIAFYGDAADEELFVIPANGSGSYINSLLLEKAMKPGIPVIQWERGPDFLRLPDHLREAEARDFCERQLLPLLIKLDPDLRSCLGEDFAMTGDLTVLWPVQIGTDMVRRPPFVVELRQIPYAQQRTILWYILDRLPRFYGAAMDATGNGAPLAQETATKYGLGLIQQIKINAGWYTETGLKFKDGFEQSLTEMPRNDDIYMDHRSIKLVRGVPHVERIPQSSGKGEDAAAGKSGKKKRHGDSAIAHWMAYIASLAAPEPGILDYYKRLNAERSARKASLMRGNPYGQE